MKTAKEVLARQMFRECCDRGIDELWGEWSQWDDSSAAGQGMYLEAAEGILAALRAAGYAIVPREPTDEMEYGFSNPDLFLSYPSGRSGSFLNRYRVLIARAEGRDKT